MEVVTSFRTTNLEIDIGIFVEKIEDGIGTILEKPTYFILGMVEKLLDVIIETSILKEIFLDQVDFYKKILDRAVKVRSRNYIFLDTSIP